MRRWEAERWAGVPMTQAVADEWYALHDAQPLTAQGEEAKKRFLTFAPYVALKRSVAA